MNHSTPILWISATPGPVIDPAELGCTSQETCRRNKPKKDEEAMTLAIMDFCSTRGSFQKSFEY